MNKDTSRAKFIISFAKFLLLYYCWLDRQKALVDESGAFACLYLSTMDPVLVYHLEDEQWWLVAAVRRRSLTP
jgi:hypothetical protein